MHKRILRITAVAALSCIVLLLTSVLAPAGLDSVTLAAAGKGSCYLVSSGSVSSSLYEVDSTGSIRSVYREFAYGHGGMRSELVAVSCGQDSLYALRRWNDSRPAELLRFTLPFTLFQKPEVVFELDLGPASVQSLSADAEGVRISTLSKDGTSASAYLLSVSDEQTALTLRVDRSAPFNQHFTDALYENDALYVLMQDGTAVKYQGAAAQPIPLDAAAQPIRLYPWDGGVLIEDLAADTPYPVDTDGTVSVPADVSGKNLLCAAANADSSLLLFTEEERAVSIAVSAKVTPASASVAEERRMASASSGAEVFPAASAEGNSAVSASAAGTELHEDIPKTGNDSGAARVISLRSNGQETLIHKLRMPVLTILPRAAFAALLIALAFAACLGIRQLLRQTLNRYPSLLGRVVVTAALGAAVILLVSGASGWFLLDRALYRQQIQTASLLSDQLSAQISASIPTTDQAFFGTDAYTRLYSALSTSDSAAYELLLLREGTLHTGVSDRKPCLVPAKYIYDADRYALCSAAASEKKAVSRMISDSWICTAQPITDAHGNTAVLLTEIPHQHPLREFLLWWGAGALLLLTLFLLFLGLRYRALLHPLKTLSNAAQRLGEGDYAFQVDVDGAGEFATMGRVFNQLCTELSSSDYRLNLLNSSYYRFVPKNVYEILGRQSVLDVRFGDNMRLDSAFAVVSLNNRDAFRRQLDDSRFMDFTNHYFGTIYSALESNKGVLISDNLDLSAVKVLYPQSADDAARAALTLCESLAALSGAFPQAEETILLHRAQILYGIAGTEDRSFPFLLSDQLDFFTGLTARFRHGGVKLVITQEIFDQLSFSIETRCIGYVSCYDTQRRYPLYEVLNAYDSGKKIERMQFLPMFEKALDLFYHNDFYAARNLFSTILRTCPDDGISRWYLFACDACFNSPNADGYHYDLFWQANGLTENPILL